MSPFSQWLDSRRSGGATKSEPGFWDTPLLKRLPAAVTTAGKYVFDKLRPKNIASTTATVRTSFADWLQNTGPIKRAVERQEGFDAVSQYAHPVDKAVYKGANAFVGAADIGAQILRATAGGVYSLGQEINQRAGLGLKSDKQMEEAVFGYQPRSVTDTYVNPAVGFAERAGSGTAEKAAIGAGAFGLGLFVESPIGLPFKKSILKKTVQQWIVKGADREAIESELRAMGLDEDSIRELADSATAVLETNMSQGSKINEISNTIDFRAKQVFKADPERSVLQVVDTKTGENVFYTIPAKDYAAMKEIIDNGYRAYGKDAAIAGNNINGKVYHLTAKTPAEMLERAGWKNGGERTVDELLNTITQRKRVTIRNSDGTFGGSYMEDAAFKKVAQDMVEENKLIEEAKRFEKIEDFIAAQGSIPGKTVAKQAKTLGSDQGGLSDYTINQIQKEDYGSQEMAISELRKLDRDLDDYLKTAKVREYDGEPFGMDPIVSSKGEVIDGYNRIHQKLVDGDETVTVYRGVDKAKLTEVWENAGTPGYRFNIGEKMSKRTVDEVRARYEKIFRAHFDIETVVDPQKMMDPNAVGQVYGRMIKFLVKNKYIDDAVANHEGWHLFKRLLSDEKISELTKMEKSFFEQVSKSDPARVKALRDSYKKKDGTPQSDRYLAEELMADEFARYYKTGKTVWEKLTVWFDDLKHRLELLFKGRADIIREFRNVADTLETNKSPRNRYDRGEEINRELGKLDPDVAYALREAKGLSADDIMKKHPDIQLVRDVVAKDIHNNRVVIPEGEALTPYELKGGKVLLQDGETYIVTKNQFQNIKGQSVEDVSKKFAPELDELGETVKGGSTKLSAKEKTELNSLQKILDEGGELTDIQEKRFNDLSDKPNNFSKTKHEGYTLPGGKDYKEILVRAPVTYDVPLPSYAKAVKEPSGQWSIEVDGIGKASDSYPSEKEAIIAYNKGTMSKDAGTFTSSHWDESNVLAHIRMNMRKYKNKAVAFMEELQSDWAREGRAKGFIDDGKPDRIVEAKAKLEAKGIELEADMSGEGMIVDKNGELLEYDNLDAETQGLIDLITGGADSFADMPKGKIPNHPLLKKWQELSIKRALKQAVDDGAEYFAWINGAQTSERYNLATYLDNVDWTRVKREYDDSSYKSIFLYQKNDKTPIVIRVEDDGTITHSSKGNWQNKKLDEVLGKGLADKIMEKEAGTLSGEGLKFGGEWAENLYDRQVKNIVEDLTGGKVETIDMGLPIAAKREDRWYHIQNGAMGSEVAGGHVLKPNDLIFRGDQTSAHPMLVVSVNGDKVKVIPRHYLDDDSLFRYVMNDEGAYNKAKKKGYLNEDGENDMGDIVTLLKKDREFMESFQREQLQYTETINLSNKIEPSQQMAIRLTPEIKAIIRGESPLTKKPSGVSPIQDGASFKISPDSEYDSIITWFSGAEAGERIGIQNADGTFAGYVAKHSTFPDWIPEDLRTRELLDKYLEKRTGDISDFANIEYKKGSRMERIDDLVRQRIFDKTGVDVRRMPDDLAYIDDIAEQYNREIDEFTGEYLRDTLQSPDPMVKTGTPTGQTGLQTAAGMKSGVTSDTVYPRKVKRALVNIAQRSGLPIDGIVKRFEGIKRVKTSILEYVQNTDERIRQLMENPEMKIEDSTNIYQKATLYHGRVGARVEAARDEAKSILQDVKKTADSLGVDYDEIRGDVDDYLIARHAPERNAAIGEKAAGMTTAEAEALKAKIEASPRGAQVMRLANQIQEMNNKTLDLLLESQIITEELHAQLRSRYKYHVPLYRVLENDADMGGALAGKGFDVRSTGIKKAKGSEKEIDDIIGNVVYNYEQAILRSEKNLVDLATLKFVRSNAENLKGIMKEAKLPFVPVGKVVHKEQVFNEVMDVVNKLITQYGGTHERKIKSGRVFGRFSPGTNTVTTRFGTSKDTLIHEFGHMLDTKFGLKESSFFTKEISAELRAVADLRDSVDPKVVAQRTKSRQAYVRKGEEKIAEFISMYFSDLDNARKVAPKAVAKFDTFLNEHPELRELKDVMKSRSRAQQELEEIVFAQQRFTNDPQILTLRENGRATYVKIEDPNLAIAVRGIGREKLGLILNGMRAFTNFYSGLHTRFNPDFALPNKLRDLQEVVTYMASQKDIGGKGAAKLVVRDPQSVKDIVDFLRGKDTEGTRLYKEMREAGGTTGGMGLSTRANVDLDIKKLDKLVNSKTRRVTENLIEYVDNWNTIFEDSTRLSVYKEARSRGLSKDRAAFLAKEASINFNRMGKGGPVINAAWMFSSASIQGSVKMLRALKNPKVLAGVAVTIGASVAATAEWNDQVDPDWREKTPKWDRLNSLVIVLPTEDGKFKYVAIPVSWGLKPIKVMADYAYDATAGHGKSAGEILEGTLTAILEGYNPVGGTDLISAITPTFLDTPFEIGRNQSWSGSMIRPTNYNNAPDDALYFQSLTETETGRQMISLSELMADKGIEISPATMKYAYEQYVGGAGRFVNRMMNAISGVITGDQVPLDEYPFVARFYRERVGDELEATKSTETQALDNLSDDDARAKKKLNVRAIELKNEVMELTTAAEKKARLKEISAEDPALAEKVLDLIEDEKAGLTPEESRLKRATVAVRAEYIKQQLATMNAAEKKAYLTELKEKKILTAAVLDALGY